MCLIDTKQKKLECVSQRGYLTLQFSTAYQRGRKSSALANVFKEMMQGKGEGTNDSL